MAGSVGYDRLQRVRLIGRREHSVGYVLDARLFARADVEVSPMTPSVSTSSIPGNGPRRAATLAGSWSRRRGEETRL